MIKCILNTIIRLQYLGFYFLMLFYLNDQHLVFAKSVSKEAKIVSGKRCPINEHPYTVSIRFTLSYEHICGGSLVNKFWVLTAAHCCLPVYRPGSLTAFVGGTRVAREERQITLIIRQVIHEKYRESGLRNDIALMELDYPLYPSETVNFIKLPKPFSDNADEDIQEVCETSTMLGWGDQYSKDTSGAPTSNKLPSYDEHLQCVRIPAISKEECEQRVGNSVPSTVFCAFTRGKDTCQGDSGGPVICGGAQYGVVSGGLGCAFKQYPGVYTRVDMYMDFIKRTTANSSLNSLSMLLRIYLLFNTVIISKIF